MDDLVAQTQAIVSQIKQLRTEKSEAVSLSDQLKTQLAEKMAELDGFAPAIELVTGMSDTAWRVLPSVIKTVFEKYRGKS